MASWKVDQDMLQRIIDALPVGVWIADTAGNLKMINPAGRDIWKGERWVGQDECGLYRGFWAGTGVPIKPEEWGMARAVLHGESSRDEMIDIICFDGSRKTILNAATLIRDEQGTPLCAVATHQDITALKTAQDELQETRQQLAALSHEMLVLQERERRRLARELHDEIGQTLTALKISLQTCCRQCRDPNNAAFGQIVEMTDSLLDSVRQLSRRLRPPQLDELGLVPALRAHLDGVEQIGSMPISLQADRALPRLGDDLELACFRIVQESVNNVLRHARARRVTVSLSLVNEELDLAISDDGCGFDPQRLKTGKSGSFPLGLLGMRERAAGLSGSLSIDSKPGAGTTVRARFPLGRT